MKSGEKITQLIKELMVFSLLGVIIFQNLRIDITSKIASEFHYRFYYILSEKFNSQHLFEHIFRVEDYDNFLLNYMAPSLFLGEDTVNQLENSKLLMNLVDTRKEKLVIDNIENLKKAWEEYGWDLEELNQPNAQEESKEEPAPDTKEEDHDHRR
jgi:hypothetical protein